MTFVPRLRDFLLPRTRIQAVHHDDTAGINLPAPAGTASGSSSPTSFVAGCASRCSAHGFRHGTTSLRGAATEAIRHGGRQPGAPVSGHGGVPAVV